MYKDKDKQKQAKMPQVKKQGIPVGGIPSGIPQNTEGIPKGIPQGIPIGRVVRDEPDANAGDITLNVISSMGYGKSPTDEALSDILPLPTNYSQPDCQCMHCRQNRRSRHPAILNHGLYKPAAELGSNELNRQGLPGDVDFLGVCNAGS